MLRSPSISPLDAPVLDRAREQTRAAGRWLAFWTAVVLPFTYLPVLLVWPWSRPVAEAFVALVGLNLVAVWLGREHRRGDAASN